MPAIITACHNNGRLEPYVELARANGFQVVPYMSCSARLRFTFSLL
jgi:hypothetical protein